MCSFSLIFVFMLVLPCSELSCERAGEGEAAFESEVAAPASRGTPFDSSKPVSDQLSSNHR